MLRFNARKSIYFLLIAFASAASFIGKSPTFEDIATSMGTGLAAAAALALADRLSLFRHIQPLLTAFVGAALAFACSRLLFSTLTPLAGVLSVSQGRQLALADSLFSLLSASWGALIALRGGEELLSIFSFAGAKAKSTAQNDLLLDASALQDPRIYDIASTGIFDKRLAIPQFIVNEMNSLSAQDDPTKIKLRRSNDIIRNLEELPHLQLKIIEDNQTSIKDSLQRLLSLAQKVKADIVTSERYRLQPATSENIRIFNLHTLASAFKPLTQSGEIITIKVQRYGKEIKQGVGYLEDNTMVVINGGGDFLGKTIRAQVLSVKHTLSGRMIFCNALSDDHDFESDADADDVFNTKTENGNSFI